MSVVLYLTKHLQYRETRPLNARTQEQQKTYSSKFVEYRELGTKCSRKKCLHRSRLQIKTTWQRGHNPVQLGGQNHPTLSKGVKISNKRAPYTKRSSPQCRRKNAIKLQGASVPHPRPVFIEIQNI